MNFFTLCLSEKLFIFPSVLNYSLAWYIILGCRFFSFSILNISCHSLRVCKGSAEKSTDSLIRIPSYVTVFFSLDALIFFIYCPFFGHFNYYEPWCGPPWVEFLAISLLLLDRIYFLPQIRKSVLMVPILSLSSWMEYCGSALDSELVHVTCSGQKLG